jgi:hypothetical protein
VSQNSAAVCDETIRPALRARLLARHRREVGTVLIEELGLCRGRVRVDLAVVNGSLHGFEIKSDGDSLRRLSTQVEVYSQVLDRATLVVGDRFLSSATELLPSWWGIVHVNSSRRGLAFKNVRRAALNPRRDPRCLAELLWASQALELLEQRDVARGVRGKPRRYLWDRICEHFSVDEIAAVVRDRLKTRVALQDPA